MPKGIYIHKPHSEEHKKKISESLKGRPVSNETRKKISNSLMGHPVSEEVIAKMKSFVGEKNSRWLHDRTKLKRSVDKRSSAYNYWRKQVWSRDNFKCKLSDINCNGRLEAHHILGWAKYPESRYELDNGITLCLYHHPRKRQAEIDLAPIFRELVKEAV